MSPIAQPTVSDDIDVAALLRAINNRKFWIASLAVAAGIATFFALSFMTPLYTSQARILIEHEQNSYKRPAASQIVNERQRTTDQEAVASQVQVLLSRDLAMGVVKDLRLEEDPEFNKEAGSGKLWRKFLHFAHLNQKPTQVALRERVLDAFLDRLSVFQLQKSRVIAVSFQSSNPDTAAKAANRLADYYLTWQQSEKLNQTKEASAWLSGQIKELTKKVEKADMAAERFRSSSGLFEGSNNTTLDVQQLSELNSQVILAKAQRTEAEARALLIEKMLKDTGGVADAADVLKSRLIQRLLEQRVTVQRELAEVSATLLPSHPRIKQLKSELSGVRRQIRNEARKVVSGLRNEAQIAGAREASLRESLVEMKLSASKGNESHIKLRALEREAKANREVLESYLSRYRDASARSDQDSVPAHASIISRAHVTSIPTFPQKGPISLISLAAVVLLGFAHTVAREIIMPQHSQRKHRRHNDDAYAMDRRAQSATGEQQAGITTLQSPSDLTRRLAADNARLIISAPQSGSADAAGLAIDAARDLAESGKNTILLDAMNEGDHVAIALDLPDAPGIHQMLGGEASFEDAVRRDPESTLHVLSGAAESGRVFDLDVDGLGPLLKALEAAYDHVVIYTAPEEASSIVSIPSRAEPALVLIAEISVSPDQSLWLADQIMSKVDGSASVAILTNGTNRSWTIPQMPFMKRTAAI
jgi:uncharacterized protein involved in exopolysaccharide biosynthesis/Mrp family chromosome partitioning ATPase